MTVRKTLLGLAYVLLLVASFGLSWPDTRVDVDPATTSILVTLLTSAP
ncbi:MAG TPA: hypothetical protein VMB23_03190 [Spirochaetia bacterium]|jgi:hypothetical protein|nr:hypothetical protein [Spirochaetia bacterium]